MKKSLRFTAAGLSVCMMAAMLAGCGSSSSTDTTAAADASEAAADTQGAEAKTSDLSFAFCTNTLNNTFQSSIDAKLSELCKENGISYTCLDPDYDLNKQLSQLSDCANSGYDAVFVIPVDSAGITSGLAEIADAGIPIFNVDTAVIDDGTVRDTVRWNQRIYGRPVSGRADDERLSGWRKDCSSGFPVQ